MSLYIDNKLLLWFKINKRSFPWRETREPYLIMIAEFMLHRTKAEQVAPVYKDFINNYPDLKLLANAKKSNIIKVTEHLGLHWRSEHFIESAKYIIKNYEGNFPSEREDLLKIPGIGDYIAGAILTVCFNKKEYVVDSNIARFINRYYGLQLSGEIRRKKIIIEKARCLFDTEQPGRFLFAILDFTAMICKPRKPECDICVLKNDCLSANEGIRENINKEIREETGLQRC
ncbi:MAG: DNA glycosylase [bacterium]|nr:DNA glycosylase [bacterium]